MSGRKRRGKEGEGPPKKTVFDFGAHDPHAPKYNSLDVSSLVIKPSPGLFGYLEDAHAKIKDQGMAYPFLAEEVAISSGVECEAPPGPTAKELMSELAAKQLAMMKLNNALSASLAHSKRHEERPAAALARRPRVAPQRGRVEHRFAGGTMDGQEIPQWALRSLPRVIAVPVPGSLPYLEPWDPKKTQHARAQQETYVEAEQLRAGDCVMRVWMHESMLRDCESPEDRAAVLFSWLMGLVARRGRETNLEEIP